MAQRREGRRSVRSNPQHVQRGRKPTTRERQRKPNQAVAQERYNVVMFTLSAVRDNKVNVRRKYARSSTGRTVGSAVNVKQATRSE